MIPVLPEDLRAVLGFVGKAFVLAIDLAASGHAVLTKRESRSAWAWCVTVWMIPLGGALLYVLFGVNRIERKAASLRRRRGGGVSRSQADKRQGGGPSAGTLPAEAAHLAPLVAVGDAVTSRPLVGGNSVRPLVNGDAAYPAMIAAIDGAQASVGLLAYIFDDDEAGRPLIAALGRAVARGVDVRLLVDDVGVGRSRRAVLAAAAAAGIDAAVFLRVHLPWRPQLLNLRNHRKILVVDGRLGFTGGMNVRASNLVTSAGAEAELDVHFELEGPVVQHLVEAFADDWAFTTGAAPHGEAWWRTARPAGEVLARGVAWDPGSHREGISLLIGGALSCARRSVRIVTPYFLPDRALVAALNVAALRGVEVDIVLPRVSDVKLAQWASDAMLWQVLVGGCRVWRTPPPFDHAKLLVVDSAWSLVGSANLDPRSLRLNFEFCVECHDLALARRIETLTDERLARAEPVTLEAMDGRPLPIRLRDGIARLASPYL